VSEPTIVAMGGGGFSTGEDEALDDHILELTGAERPRVCFLPTASGDSDSYIVRFYDAFGGDRARASHLPLFARHHEDVRALLLNQDVIYVGGGNTANMLAVWRLHGVDAALRDAWEAGVVLCGLSAGSLCWFEGGVTDSFGSLRDLRDGLGLLPGTHCPHYSSESGRRSTYLLLVTEGLPGGLAADDGVALRFAGTELAEVVSARDDAHAYRVDPNGSGVDEHALQARRIRPKST
jgi:dipeptidase E